MKTIISEMTGNPVEISEEGIDWSPVRTDHFNCLQSSGCKTAPDEADSFIHRDNLDCGICGARGTVEVLAATEGRCTCWSIEFHCTECGKHGHA